ncbi:DUF1616 domain-containing protein [Halobellus inordinatus]|uniref:DUF1616 domain-containing protein n=1 Tax=Halobellus inordinatus TaxID=1126236 RepID=UPI0021159FA4|nr:DUF1616 domain-containing protein [Halobellus ramosii]
MASGQDWRLLFPRQLRALPADLTAVLSWVLISNIAVFAPVIRQTPIRVVVGLPLVLFIPGYALIAALFPEAGTSPEHDTDNDTADASADRSGIDGIERVALSFGLSIAVVPLLGLVLNFTPFGIRLTPIMVAVSGFTVLMTATAAQRRWELPSEEQFQVPYHEWIADARSELLAPDTRGDAALNVLLVVSLLLAVSSVGYAVAVPQDGESFSELYLLTENDEGELVADGYPTNFTVGEPRSLVVGVGNHEHEQVQYTVVVELQRVNIANNSTTVLERESLNRFEPTVGANETWHQPHTVSPTMTGERLRLTYLLYRGAPPQKPSVDSAYREVHLWVNVSR